MKLQSILTTLLVAFFVLSGCSKDNEGSKGNADGAKSLVNISFSLPVSTPTRAQTEQTATAEESYVANVSVYIFDIAGTAVSEGSYTYLDRDKFETTAPTVSPAVWTLKAGNEITTVSGPARIYVGINIPAAYRQAYASESALLAVVANLDEIKTDNNFTMISEATPVSLQSIEDVAVNVVPLSVDRVVSKVVGSYDPAGNFVLTWKASEADPAKPTSYTSDVTLTYQPLSYGVYQYAIKTYLAKNPSTLINNLGSTYQPEDVVKAFGYAPGGNTTLYSGHSDSDPSNGRTWDCIYVGENMPASTLFGNTTYAYIATKVTVSHYAEWNSTNKNVDYKNDQTYTDHVWVINYEGVDVLTNSSARADAIVHGLNDLDPTGTKKATMYVYYEGIVHFRVYLNKNGSNDYRVGRNEYIHLRVNGISQLNGGIFPGNPGLPEDPEDKPVNPNEKDPTPPGPKPTDPEDPIDPAEAVLSVTITVNEWAYKPNNIQLQ